ncbi:MAG TPA: type II toxin-antitoxin system VapC family toxin [Dehalococcoidia bacterium]|nr:type II toxin-antitoxin system VapC family toxin [Dehalococcoidia bacterium]
MTYQVLDTDSIIDYLKGVASSVAFILSLGATGHTLATTGVVVGEVSSGLHPQDRPAGEQLLDSLIYLPTSRNAARQAGLWRYTFARQGIALAMTDALIAATAREHGAMVVTGNVRDFPMLISGSTLLPLPRVAQP